MLIEFLTQTLEGDKTFSFEYQVIATTDVNDQESKIIFRKTIVSEKLEKDIHAFKDFVGESGF